MSTHLRHNVTSLLAAGLCLSPLVLASNAFGQTALDTWTIEDGLPQNSVYEIVQTRDGYLWLATLGGLVRYDGVRFVVFDRGTDGIGSLRTRALFEDSAGVLWAGTDDGMLIRYRERRFTTFTVDDGLPGGEALRIEEDDDGLIWITWRGVITRYDGETFTNFMPGDFPDSVAPAEGERALHQRALWWSLDARGLHCLRAGRVSNCLRPDELPEGDIIAVTTDVRDALWIHTADKGVLQLAGGRRRVLTLRDGLSGNPRWLFEDGQGTLWQDLTTEDPYRNETDGLYRVAHGRKERLTDFSVFTLYQDREGSVWLGSVVGLHRLRDLTISNLTVDDGLTSNNVYSLLRDSRDNIWVGTWGGGLNQYTQGRFRSFGPEHGLPSEYVTTIYEDAAGKIYAGTDAGLSYLDGDRFVTYDDPSGWLSGNVWDMHEDRRGGLWFATDQGLVRRQDGRLTRYTSADGLSHDSVKTLFEDRSGVLWIGAFHGITKFHDGRFTAYTERDGLIGNDVRGFHEDVDGVLWIGTYDGGLYRLEDDRLTRYTTSEGLYDNGVFQILEDDRGYFWMCSNRGLYRVSRRALNEVAAGTTRSVRSRAFGIRDGLAALECNGGRQPSGLKMDDGTLWFPTQGGIAVVDPTLVESYSRPPPVLIEEFRVGGNAIEFREGVEAPPDLNSFEIEYTAMSFVNPEQVTFRHRLVGLDDEWIEAGGRRSATYYRIPPGQYRFEVAAAVSDGAWSESKVVSVVVLAPFWRRWRFLTLAALALVGVAAAVDRRRTARQRRKHARQKAYAQQLLETQENERRRISNELHDSLGQDLFMIKAQARAAAATSGEDAAREALDAVIELATTAHDRMKEISYDLRPYQLDKIGLSKTIEGMLRRVSGACGIAFDVDIEGIDQALPPDARITAFRIVQEAVNNVVKHSGVRRARIVINGRNGSTEIRVEDDGRGFQPGLEDSRGGSGAGFGLMGMQERAESLGGRLIVRSSPGNGTTVLARFPRREQTHD